MAPLRRMPVSALRSVSIPHGLRPPGVPYPISSCECVMSNRCPVCILPVPTCYFQAFCRSLTAEGTACRVRAGTPESSRRRSTTSSCGTRSTSQRMATCTCVRGASFLQVLQQHCSLHSSNTPAKRSGLPHDAVAPHAVQDVPRV